MRACVFLGIPGGGLDVQGEPQLGVHCGHASAEIARPGVFGAEVRQPRELPKVTTDSRKDKENNECHKEEQE